MENISKNRVLSFKLLLLFLFLIFRFSQANAGNSELVDSVCAETINYTKCLEALSAIPRIESAKDLKDLAKISLQLAIANAKESFEYLVKQKRNTSALIGSNNNSNTSNAPIKQCVALYEAAIGSLRSALVELEEDAMSANYDIKMASEGVDRCENVLVLKRVRLPSLYERNYRVKFYSNIGDVITNKL